MSHHKNNILISGGSSGIGQAIANKFADQSYNVIVADRHNPKGDIKNIHFKKTDVQKINQVKALYEWILRKFDYPTILVLNAGQGIQEKLLEGHPEKWQEIINTNLLGALNFIRVFVPQMVNQKSGHVLFISSVSAGKPYPSGGIYVATKTALEIIAETLRLETLPYLKVTTISPGVTDTNFFSNCIGGHPSVDEMNMGAITPEEIADDIFYCVHKKNHTVINKIITRPLKQEF